MQSQGEEGERSVYFQCGEEATESLKRKDKRLDEGIDKIGKTEREIEILMNIGREK